MLTATHTKVIDDITYTTKTFPATEALVLLPSLITLVGDQLIAIMMSADSDEALEKLLANPEVISAAVTSIARNASKVDGGWLLLRDLLRHTKADKVRIGENTVEGSVHEHFNSHFTGRYMHLINVCIWVAQVSFSEP